jgi:hypothetical protein
LKIENRLKTWRLYIKKKSQLDQRGNGPGGQSSWQFERYGKDDASSTDILDKSPFLSFIDEDSKA